MLGAKLWRDQSPHHPVIDPGDGCGVVDERRGTGGKGVLYRPNKDREVARPGEKKLPGEGASVGALSRDGCNCPARQGNQQWILSLKSGKQADKS